MTGLTTKTSSRPVSQISMPISEEGAACSSRAVNKTIEGEDDDSTCHGLVARARFNKPKVTSETEYCFVSGNTALMQCQITGKVEKVSWKKRKETDDAFCDIRIDNKKYFGGSVACPSLVIASVGGDDAGTYICRATNDVGEGETGDIEVTVKDNVQDNVAVMPTVFNQAVEIAKTSNVNVNFTFLNNVNSSIFGENGLIVNQDTTDRDPKKLLQNMEEISRAAKSEAQKYVEAFGKIQKLGLHLEEGVRDISVKFIIDDDVTPDSNIQNKLRRLISKALNVPDGRIIRIKIIKHCIIVSFDIVGASNPWEMSALWLAERFRSGLADGSICLTDGQGNPLSIREDSTEIFNVSSENPDSSDIPIVSLEKGCYMEAVGGITILKCTALSSLPIISVKWFRINKEQETEYEINIDNKKYYGGSVESPSLVINNTDHSDQGLYICRAENKHGTGDSKPGLLLIINDDGQVLIESRQESMEARQDISSDNRETIEIPQKSMVAKQGSLDAKQDSMEVKQESLEAKQESMIVKQKTEKMVAKQGSLDAKQELMVVKQESMEAEQESMDAKQDSTEVKQESLEAKQESMIVKQKTMETMSDSMASKRKTTDTMSDYMNSERKTMKTRPKYAMFGSSYSTAQQTSMSKDVDIFKDTTAVDVWTGSVSCVHTVKGSTLGGMRIPWLTGGIFTDNNELLITDFHDNRLLLFDDNYTYQREYKIDGHPTDIARGRTADEMFVAVNRTSILRCTLQNGQLSMNKIISRIIAPPDTWGIAVFGDKLLAGIPDSVKVMSIDGNVTKSINKGGDSTYIAVSTSNSTVYYRDDHDVVCRRLDSDREVYRYRDPGLIDPRGIGLDRDHNVYVCGHSSGNVYLISPDGSRGRVLLPKLSSITNPWCIVVHPTKQEFVVTSPYGSTSLEVYRFGNSNS
ncbi:uncharacterized protein [Argopecten irradians]|uniref:uncharacterized protein n=1 Tax=Argopecten irradians TaxID=31199 RepID=UPI003718B6F0